MVSDYTCGTFKVVRGKECAEFWKKCGVPCEMAEKINGSHWCLKIGKSGDKYVFFIGCEELPAMNVFECCKMGEEMRQNKPGMGGCMKSVAKKTGDNCFEVCMESSEFGKMKWTEEYCAKGVKMCFKHENGASFSEEWCRCIDINGTYVYDKDEGMKDYLKKTNSPFPIDETYKNHTKACGNKLCITDWVGGHKVTTKATLDEEFDMEFMGEKASILVTKTGPFCYKTIVKNHSRNMTEEYEQTYCQDGFFMLCRNLTVGATCKVWMKKVCDTSGTYKPISHHGAEKLFKCIGVPEELACKVINECDARLVIEEKGCFHRHCYKSKHMPMDISFKLDEEFCFTNPKAPDMGATTNIVTKCKDSLILCSKTKKFDMKQCFKFTNHFLIKSWEICGTGICGKSIFERCCE